MKAVGYQRPLPIDHVESLVDIVLPEPVALGRDLLVEVKAISVNPVDTKIRKSTAPASPPNAKEPEWKVLGWDASGIVRAVGADVSLFKPGDRVWYAGAINRPGSNSELQLVDERIVGRMPDSLDFAQAAALPLTSITAWEMLFDRLQIERLQTAGFEAAKNEHDADKALLIIGAAGGVGSIMTQLASHLTRLTVIATASRPETQAWVKKLGAHHVIDHGLGLHGLSLIDQLKRIGLAHTEAPHYIVSLTHTDQHFTAIAEVIAAQGKFGLIDDPELIDVRLLKRKSVSLHWELMFTRALYATRDMQQQHDILNEIARLVDAGVIQTTLGEHLGVINAANLKQAHAVVESGKAQGKLVLEGF